MSVSLEKSRRSSLPWLALGVLAVASAVLKLGAPAPAPEVGLVFSPSLPPWAAGGVVWMAPRLIPLLMPDAPFIKGRR
jgi:hypothetical protein